MRKILRTKILLVLNVSLLFTIGLPFDYYIDLRYLKFNVACALKNLVQLATVVTRE